MKVTTTVIAGDGYNRLLKEVDEDSEIGFIVEGLDSRGKPYHFDYESFDLANRLFRTINP